MRNPLKSRRALAKLKARSTVAACLAERQFQPKAERPKKGKGAYKRTPKHEV